METIAHLATIYWKILQTKHDQPRELNQNVHIQELELSDPLAEHLHISNYKNNQGGHRMQPNPEKSNNLSSKHNLTIRLQRIPALLILCHEVSSQILLSINLRVSQPPNTPKAAFESPTHPNRKQEHHICNNKSDKNMRLHSLIILATEVEHSLLLGVPLSLSWSSTSKQTMVEQIHKRSLKVYYMNVMQLINKIMYTYQPRPCKIIWHQFQQKANTNELLLNNWSQKVPTPSSL